MTPDEVRVLLAGGETLTTEFKSGQVNDNDLVEAVTCLANGSGGTVLIGVDDDGTVRGIDRSRSDRDDPVRLQALVEHRTEPHLHVTAEVVELDAKRVVIVVVPRTSHVTATAGGRFVRRTVNVRGEPECLPMRPHELYGRAGSLGLLDFSAAAAPGAVHDDLSELELSRFRRLAGAQGDRALADLSTENLLRALGLETAEGSITVGAVLLFGTEASLGRHVPGYELAFQVLTNLSVRRNEIGRRPLLQAMEYLVDQVEAHNPEEEIQQGMLRVGLPRFAPVAVRELIANALVHRDYTAQGMTLVQVEGDSLVVTNPGGFPEGVSQENVLVAPPRHRNPLMANAFQRAGVVERTGRGINRVYESQLAIGHPAPDYSRTTSASVVVLLRSGPADRELAGYVAESRMRGDRIDLDTLLILHEVRHERRINTARAAELLQVPPTTARAELNRLVESGLLEARGETKSRTYHLSAAVYRRLGEPTEYVRTRGFEGLQQEQMVLTYVQRHGSIARREAAELCQLAPEQAGRLLRRMRDEAKLAQVGERRHARYVEARVEPP